VNVSCLGERPGREYQNREYMNELVDDGKSVFEDCSNWEEVTFMTYSYDKRAIMINYYISTLVYSRRCGQRIPEVSRRCLSLPKVMSVHLKS
jgi:hypothetical protein